VPAEYSNNSNIMHTVIFINGSIHMRINWRIVSEQFVLTQQVAAAEHMRLWVAPIILRFHG